MNTFPYLPDDEWKAEIRNKQHQELLRSLAFKEQQKVKACVEYFLNLKKHGPISTGWECEDQD